MTEITLPHNGWRPRGYQMQLWGALESGVKRAVAVWHRRAGKDDVTLHWTACAAMQKPAVYWHMLPQAEQARKAIWAAVNPHTGKRRIDEAFPHELRESTRENDMFIRFRNGSTWQVVGSDNYNSLVGSPPIGIVFSEWALSDPSSWAYLRPILRENGGWALFIYTPRGRNHGATTYESHKDDPEWFVQKLTAHDTDVFSKQALDLELREYIREFGKSDGDSRFRQEYLLHFNVAVIGSYYGRELTLAEDEGRITALRHNKDYSVDTWWDLGRRDPTSVWFVQHIAQQIHVIDHFSESYCEPSELAKMLQARREKHGYVYGTHIAPHDAGAIRQGMGNKSLQSMFFDLGYSMSVQPRDDVQPGIVRTRQILDRCVFDREKCALGLESLRNYHKEWSDKTKSYSNQPKHDWSSHDTDGFRTGACAYHDVKGAREPEASCVFPHIRTETVTMGGLVKCHHHYVNAKCVARYPIVTRPDGVYLMGPITLVSEESVNGKNVQKWDEKHANEECAGPFASETEAIVALRRKLTPPRPTMAKANGHDAFAKWKKRHTEAHYPDADAGD